MKRFISLIIVLLSISCFTQDKFDIIKKRRIAKIEAMRTREYNEQKIKWFNAIEIKGNNKAYIFTAERIKIDEYKHEQFNFQVVKNCFGLFGNYRSFEKFNRSCLK